VEEKTDQGAMGARPDAAGCSADERAFALRLYRTVCRQKQDLEERYGFGKRQGDAAGRSARDIDVASREPAL